MKTTINLTVDDLDNLRRLEGARRDLEEIANLLMHQKSSKKEQRQEFARRLNAIRASLNTVVQNL